MNHSKGVCIWFWDQAQGRGVERANQLFELLWGETLGVATSQLLACYVSTYEFGG